MPDVDSVSCNPLIPCTSEQPSSKTAPTPAARPTS
jgi:hypothetical protein